MLECIGGGRRVHGLRSEQQAGEVAHRAADIQEARLGRLGGSRLRRGRLRHDRELGRTCGIDRGGARRRRTLDRVARRAVVDAIGRCWRDARSRRLRTNPHPGERRQCRVDLPLAVEEFYDRVLFELQLVGGRLEAVLGRNQGAVHFVQGDLQVGDAVFIGGRHLLIAMVLRRDDPVLEDDVDGGERDPAQEDQRQAREGRLQRRAECEELHAPVGADVDLALRERFMEPSPDALYERPCHANFSLVCVLRAKPNRAHFTQLSTPNQALTPEKRP